MRVNLQITTKAYDVAETSSVLVWIDVFKVGADTKDVKRTGCPTADWPDEGEERLCKLVHVNRVNCTRDSRGHKHILRNCEEGFGNEASFDKGDE